jgi:hypothetical protein
LLDNSIRHWNQSVFAVVQKASEKWQDKENVSQDNGKNSEGFADFLCIYIDTCYVDANSVDIGELLERAFKLKSQQQIGGWEFTK